MARVTSLTIGLLGLWGTSQAAEVDRDTCQWENSARPVIVVRPWEDVAYPPHLSNLWFDNLGGVKAIVRVRREVDGQIFTQRCQVVVLKIQAAGKFC